MTAATSLWTVPVPERMWFATTRFGYSPEGRDPNDASAFAHWLRDSKVYLNPWSGKPHEFDERLREVQPGDPVFAYESDIGIAAIGHVSNPKELRSVGPNLVFPSQGALILALSVDWDTSVTRTVRQVWDETNVGGSAFKSCGRGTRFYAMAVEMLQELHDRHRGDPDASEANAVKRIASSRAYTPKMKAQLGQARIGQGQFRKAVLTREPACRVTGVGQPPYLVASHIKPWALCVGDEHLDGANGLMLAPHVDHLFDTGRISFTDDGNLLLAPALDPAILRAWHIGENLNVGHFSLEQARYLAYHRQFVLGQPRPRRQRNLVGEVPGSILTYDDLQSAVDEIAETD